MVQVAFLNPMCHIKKLPSKITNIKSIQNICFLCLHMTEKFASAWRKGLNLKQSGKEKKFTYKKKSEWKRDRKGTFESTLIFLL